MRRKGKACMQEPILEARLVFQADDYPRLFLAYNAFLILLFAALYAVHVGPGWAIVDLHSGDPLTITEQIFIITLGLCCLPCWLFLYTKGLDHVILPPSARADIKATHRFLQVLFCLYLLCTVCIFVFDWRECLPCQSILVAYLLIFASLSFWPAIRERMWRKKRFAVDVVLADLLPDESAPESARSPGFFDR